MADIPRHQCCIYDGAPAKQLPVFAAAIREKLAEGYRCLYLNNPALVSAFRSSLAAAGVDVARHAANGSLILTSDRDHLVNGRFVADNLMRLLEDTLARALADGHRGLFATGDMSWEFGPEEDYSRLVEYEWLLEKFFRTHPNLSGICQYHAGSLPPLAVEQGRASHPALFVNETLSRINPAYSFQSLNHPMAGPGLDGLE